MKTLEHISTACNDTLPPLIPPGGWDTVPHLNNLAGEYLLKGRNEVRRRGRKDILATLAQAVDTTTWSGRPGAIPATHWERGTSTTSGGADGRPGQGKLFQGNLAEHAAQLIKWAEWDPEVAHAELLARLRTKNASPNEIRAAIKRASPARTVGLSRFGGRAEYEFEGRLGLFMDNDGEGPPDLLKDTLRELGLAYLFQARPGSGRCHIELFFSAPFRPEGLVYPLDRAPPPEVPLDLISQWLAKTRQVAFTVKEHDDYGEPYTREVPLFSATEKRAFSDYTGRLQGWKRQCFTPVMAWLLGLFSELGNLNCRWIVYGAKGPDGRPLPHRDLATASALHGDHLSISHLGHDAVPAQQALGLGYPYTRRATTDPVPITEYHDGHMLSVMRATEATGFIEPPEHESRVRGGLLPEAPERSSSLAEDPVAAASETSLSRLSLRVGIETGDLPNAEAPTPYTVRVVAGTSDRRTRPAFYAAIVEGFRVAGLVQRPLSDKTQVICPYVGGHTNADKSGTAVMGNGSVKCHHGSCGDRSQTDFLTALPLSSQVAIVNALPGLLPDDFPALFLPSVLSVSARVRLLAPDAFERALHRLVDEDMQCLLGRKTRISRWYSRVRAEKVI